jgi:hypothetical protein
VKIVVRKEKHDTRYYDASTPAKLQAAALLILAERMDPEYAFIVKPERPDSLDKEPLTPEKIAALPNDALRKVAENQVRRYRIEKREYDEALTEWNAAMAAVTAGDGATAAGILQARHRAGHEYEGFEIESAPTAGPPGKALLARIAKLT